MSRILEMTYIEMQLVFILRIVVAAGLGAFIGVERTIRQKEAGIRTHLIVSMGACLFMLVSKYGFFDIVGQQGATLDASRIAAQVVSGIGFLGAGIIFFKNDYVRGLTTAAGVWSTGAVGLAVGAGLYITAISGTLLIVVFQTILYKVVPAKEYFSFREIAITIYDKQDSLKKLEDQLAAWHLNVKSYNVTRYKNEILVKIIVTDTGDIPADTAAFVQKHGYIKSIVL